MKGTSQNMHYTSVVIHQSMLILTKRNQLKMHTNKQINMSTSTNINEIVVENASITSLYVPGSINLNGEKGHIDKSMTKYMSYSYQHSIINQ